MISNVSKHAIVDIIADSGVGEGKSDMKAANGVNGDKSRRFMATGTDFQQPKFGPSAQGKSEKLEQASGKQITQELEMSQPTGKVSDRYVALVQ